MFNKGLEKSVYNLGENIANNKSLIEDKLKYLEDKIFKAEAPKDYLGMIYLTDFSGPPVLTIEERINKLEKLEKKVDLLFKHLKLKTVDMDKKTVIKKVTKKKK